MDLKIGIRGHDLVTNSDVETLVEKLKLHNLKYLQLVFPKTFKDYTYEDVFVENVSKVLKENDIKVAMLGAYFNPVHSDKEVVKKGVNNFISNLNIANKFNNPYVGSETGSYNDSPWTYVPKNHTQEAYDEVYSVFKNLVEHAIKIDQKIVIEPAFNHCIYNVNELSNILKRFDSDNVFVTVDLFNLLSLENYQNKNQVFEEALKTFNSKVKIIHIKDSILEDGKIKQVNPFEGDFDYEFMLKTINKYSKDAVLIFEGVKEESIDNAYIKLKEIAEKI